VTAALLRALVSCNDALRTAYTATDDAMLRARILEVADDVIDATTTLYRFRCVACGRLGCWLEQRAAVVRNAASHVRHNHADTPPTTTTITATETP